MIYFSKVSIEFLLILFFTTLFSMIFGFLDKYFYFSLIIMKNKSFITIPTNEHKTEIETMH